MKKVHVLLGDFTFYKEEFDGIYKCVIHRIDEIMEIDKEKVDDFCEESLDTYESYFVPEIYGGLIEMNT